MPANKNSFGLVTLLISTALFTSLCSCSKKESPEEEPIKKLSADSVKLSNDAIANLKLRKVVQGEFPDQLSIMGRISVPEDRIAVIPARVAGRIDAVYVASGEVVTRGQSMASLFSPDFVIAREEYVQALKQSQSAGDPDSKRLLELSRRKLDALGMSEVDIQALSQSKAGMSENLIIRTPRSGALLDKKAVVGTFVNQGDTLFTVGDLGKVWFAGDIYPEDLKKVRKNQEVTIEPTEGSPSLHGKVSFISPVVDPSTRTIKIRALMDNPGQQLRADMYVKGNVILSKRIAIVAPKNALVRLRDHIFCFKRGQDNVFKRVEVKVEAESGDQVAISEGLGDGDEVVSEGALLLDAALTGGAT